MYAEVKLLFWCVDFMSFLWSITIVVLLIAVEFIATAFTMQIFDEPYEILASDMGLRVQSLIISKIFFVIVAFLIVQIAGKLGNRQSYYLSAKTVIRRMLLQVVFIAILYSTLYFDQLMVHSVFVLYMKYIVYIMIFVITIILISDSGKKAEKKALELELSIANSMRESQEALYRNLEVHIRDIYRTLHDMRHEVRYLKQMNITEPQIAAIESKISAIELPSLTDNQALAVILADVSNRCQSKDIQFTYSINSNLVNAISFGDTITIFANLLDNAMNACDLIENESCRYIDFKAQDNENNLTIFIVNSKLKGSNRKTQSMKHGYGRRSVELVLRNLGGHMVFNESDEKYSVIMYIPRQYLQ